LGGYAFMSIPHTSTPTLDDVHDTSWRLLERGAVDKRDPAQSPTLVTQGGEFPEGRTVILRRVKRAERMLICHSDVRAKKVDEIRKNPFVSWHVWHPKRRIQLRLYAQAWVHHEDDFCREEWNKVPPSSRLNYSAEVKPGTPVASLADSQEPYTQFEGLSDIDTDSWYPNFCAIRTQILYWEYLHLARGGHVRASFVWEEEEWRGQWLVI